MNTKQKKQVAGWIGAIVLITVSIIYNEEILKRWEVIQWPILVLIITLAIIFKPKEGYKKDSEWINRISTKYPILKVWVCIYVILLAIFIYDSLSTGRDLFKYMGGNWVLITILLLILPLIILLERERFISNGK